MNTHTHTHYIHTNTLTTSTHTHKTHTLYIHNARNSPLHTQPPRTLMAFLSFPHSSFLIPLMIFLI